MGLLSKIGKCVDVLLDEGDGEEVNINYEKGITFEKYVIGMFSKKYFSVNDWTRDLSGKSDGVVVESDANPDLVMRYKPKDVKIAIECKFRSSLYKGELQWTSAKKLAGYKMYMKKSHLPTYIVVGLGGTPDAPERMFCIPLKAAKYPSLYPSVFEKFERSPDKNFFWNGKELL